MLDKSTSTVAAAKSRRRNRLPNVVRGVLAGFSASGDPLVDFSSNSTGTPILAASATLVQSNDIGREAILLFEDADLSRPILIGLVQPPAPAADTKNKLVDITVDGQRLTVSAQEEIVLRCGEASITLTKAGKVVIKGMYVLSRSSGVNRIKGGSIQLN